VAEETVLCESAERLHHEIEACGNREGNKAKFLKQQINSRLTRAHSMGMGYPVSSVGGEFRSEKTKKIKVTAPNKELEVEYLNGLVIGLMAHDKNAPRVVGFQLENALRPLPRISEASTFESSVHVKGEFERTIWGMVEVDDDDDLLTMRDKYLGKLAYDREEKTCYRVLDVNLTSHRAHEYWAVCCVPVVCIEGTWMVEDRHIAGGSSAALQEERKPVYLHEPLEYFALGEVLGADEVRWTTSDLDEMILAFERDEFV